jgi:hypothetical protein
MKKLFLGAAALLFMGAVFAQNTSYSNQTGDDERVYVRQAGTNLSSAIIQGNGSGLGSHRAMVLQKGDLNASDIYQEGTNNQAYVDQFDFTPPTSASSNIYQGKNNTASANNKARVEQHGGTNSVATLNQDGEANEAKTHQDGTDGVVNITQDGTANKSYVAQLPFYSAVGNTADIYQTDEYNQSWAYQDGDYNYLSATQSGMENKADQYQSGNGNTANSNQSGFNGKAKQIQVGDNNINNLVFQTGSGNYSEDNQYGNGNEIFKGQEGADNYGRIDQTGNDNYTSFGQYGTNSRGYAQQIGNGNYLTMGQFAGDNNAAFSYQDDNNWGITQQTGNNNQALLVQKSQGGAGHFAEIWQNGNCNTADVLQLGPEGDWAADAENCFFPDPVELNTPTPLPEVMIEAPCPTCPN